MAKLNFDELPEPGNRFLLEECVGSGVCGKVYSAIDSEAGGRKIAIKMQNLSRENVPYIQEEYRILHELSNHPNLPEFYGVYRKIGETDDEIWFCMELCEGGPVIDLVSSLIASNRRMSEEHIAFIVKEVVKALIHLHGNHVIHRDVRGSNILLNKDGEVKLVDFGLCRRLSSTLGKSSTCVGCPCWMAPEVVASSRSDEDDDGYGNRADVWALGITTIELGDGKAPFEDMHPTRAMFQIVRNPPPTFYRPANWTEPINDFVNECLVKNPEHRPFIMELMEHPFLADVPDNNYHLSQELKALMSEFKETVSSERAAEAVVNSNFLKKSLHEPSERMNVEDLAALDRLSEDVILQELGARLRKGHFHTFVGDILLILNPNERQDIYNEHYHKKYQFKSRSDNAPHIFSVADSAYQDALHQGTPQNVVISGESGSGKTTSFLHLVDHLVYIAQNPNVNTDRITNSIKLLHAFTHAATPINESSTRCVLKTELTFANTGKVTGAVFGAHQLDKWRVSSVDMVQGNYHIFYYAYDGLKASGKLEKYELKSDRSYRYLRVREDENPRRIEGNARSFQELMGTMSGLGMTSEQVEAVLVVLSAVLNLGDVRFKDGGDSSAAIENEDCAAKVARLLKVDEKKFSWALTNYCLLERGAAVRRRHNSDEARDARDSLANALYSRLLDYLVSVVNHKLSYGRAIFGEKHSIKIYDFFGFECFKRNQLPQLFANTLNEQLHYHYLQRVFAWEALEMNQEDVPFAPLQFYDNRATLDQILGKPEGVITLIDDAARMGHGGQYVIDYLQTDSKDNVTVVDNMEFSIAHYTGKVTYDAKEMPDRNRDFVPPEIIETLRLSKNAVVKALFANKLSKVGQLYVSFDEGTKRSKKKFKCSSSSSEEERPGEYSQVKKMRTAASVFRSLCLELLKELSVGGGAGGTHFVRCLRSDLHGKPKGFHPDMVKQQLRALAVLETTKARQRGYPFRIPFNEFLRRYQFLAFDFDENVDVTKDNCRLLLVRLKMEGWAIGKSKVFLKYYNEEYLARLYETQVKKIVKIQSMMRSFLARRRLAKKQNGTQHRAVPQQETKNKNDPLTEDEAALVLQKAYRSVACRKAYPQLVSKQFSNLDEDTCRFIKLFARKWKARSMFQVLLQYRSARYYDMFNVSQQVHLYNQNVVHLLQKSNNNIGLDLVNSRAQPNAWLGEQKPIILKMPFRFDDVPYFDTSYLCDPLTNPGVSLEHEESWDSPFQWRETISSHIASSLSTRKDEPKLRAYSAHHNKSPVNAGLYQQRAEKLIHVPFTRDPDEPMKRLSSINVDYDFDKPTKKQQQPQQQELPCCRCNCQYQPEPPRRYDYEPPRFQFQQTSSYEPKPAPKSSVTFYNNGSTSPGVENGFGKLNNCSKPANKDFDYIKPTTTAGGSSTKQSSANPIAELQSLGRRSSGSHEEDEAPFNFQGMLRKTNVMRESLKRISENKVMLSGSKSVDFQERSHFRVGSLKKQHRSAEFTKTEIAPGVYVEGIEADL